MNTNLYPCPSPSSIHVSVSQPSKHFYNITKQHGTIQVLKSSLSLQCTHPHELILFVLKMFIQVSIGHCTQRGRDKPYHNTLSIHQRGTRLKHKGLGFRDISKTIKLPTEWLWSVLHNVSPSWSKSQWIDASILACPTLLEHEHTLQGKTGSWKSVCEGGNNWKSSKQSAWILKTSWSKMQARRNSLHSSQKGTLWKWIFVKRSEMPLILQMPSFHTFALMVKCNKIN
jgi:hypothetical protein